MMPDRSEEPSTNKMKWKYGDILKAASANVRGIRNPITRDHYTNGKEWNRYNVSARDLIPDSCCEVRKGYTFVFSSASTDREHWGVGLCYKSYMEI